MSSPSGCSNAGKRKRTSTNPTMAANAEMDPMLQPSSRDASGEEGDTTAPESSSRTHMSKRQRANSERTANSTMPPAQLMTADPGEPSDTTEASLDIANRVGRKNRKLTNPTISTLGKDIMDVEVSEDKHKDGSAMPPPPMGNMVHPAGYRTNPPPVGRLVRVYADGVFDLFHLGYVLCLTALLQNREKQINDAAPDRNLHLLG